ncbi:uncharacterized protein [Ptychodera flava]|uniref:uncharacterized protein isoform X2 n=1 Tax=Ptychodera flava TaxID=63121 RepID=UPI00396A207D
MGNRFARRNPTRVPETSAATQTVWPALGANIRIWSLLSHENDGFWQVQRQSSDDIFSVDGAGTYNTNSVFRFYAVNDPEIIGGEPGFADLPDDSTLAWIGIPGRRIGKDADSSKIYMLQWKPADGGVHTKAYKAPKKPWELPDIPDKDDRKFATFLISFNSSTKYFNILCAGSREARDGWKNIIRTDGSGNISIEESMNQDKIIILWSTDPGIQYYLSFVDKVE